MATMHTLSSIPSMNSVISAYTAFAGSAMLARSIFREFQSLTTQLIPLSIREKIASRLFFMFRKPSPHMTLVIEEHVNGVVRNEVYEACQLYLQGKISPRNKKLKVTKARGDNDLTVAVTHGEEIIDFYDGITLSWVLVCAASHTETHGTKQKAEHKSFSLCFLKEHKEAVLGSYLPYVLEFAKSKKEANKAVTLKWLGGGGGGGGGGGWINLNHPSTFDTLAMEPSLKKAIKDDLDRFVKRREFYKRVGKAWKRGYLLYGPPGTGKSSLIAAMANYLKYNVYDLDLTSVWDNRTLNNLLVSTQNRSIVVIEDIDCSVELNNRNDATQEGEASNYTRKSTKITLSGLLNLIDGLWSSCGDERIIVFTTNYKEKLDPALLRPGRMDMHIHMSYLTPCGFRVLASNYLGLSSHPLFSEIEGLIEELEMTPATVAEELMKDDGDPDATLQLLLEFLLNKKLELVGGGGEVKAKVTTMTPLTRSRKRKSM